MCSCPACQPKSEIKAGHAEYVLTVSHDGRIQMLSSGFPPIELKEWDIPLTKEEFYFLNKIDGQIVKAMRIIKAVQRKVTRKIKR